MKKIVAASAIAVLTHLTWNAVAQAQEDYPQRAVTITVPYSPGGTTDYVARMLARQMSEVSKQSFVVENKPGASGTIATAAVMRAKPDGYSLLMNDTTYAMLPAVFKKLSWDPVRDIAPVSNVASTPVILIVPANSPFNSLAELVDAARKKPESLTFGSGGKGSSTHLAGEVFQHQANIKLLHVPYKGAGEALLALVGGTVDVEISATPTAIPQINSGKVKALAISSPQRLPQLPDVPTFAQAGLPDYQVQNWFGLVARAGTPPEIITKLNHLVKEAVADPSIRSSFEKLGAQAVGNSSQEFSQQIASEIDSWGRTAERAGLEKQ
ncbi:Bug family tripartite tricarboxylate transporter substrate binding protein [Advenella mimigardefordensis]|uniref:Putative Bug-like extracytoplasmic solute binding receptor, TTT family n=1 Tax=Advenella mimigardefordensis (strain DSM 17166 / LMG 22922 / DPN7) TaxID=1247726 RepID=W0PA30_ADVMD|nr:tripartite tricarboxylate transporter substrate binding protein [Advenella mimigardefordensis]AHG62352.1 putative Bug-like extracytoplasmic solute binding receptor, TTT family [Advenella mimigardefordensis DPN7]